MVIRGFNVNRRFKKYDKLYHSFIKDDYFKCGAYLSLAYVGQRKSVFLY